MENEMTTMPTETQMISWSPNQVMEQVRMIQELMKQGMNDGEHFGVIPGTNSKPTLLKAGAEKLCLMFRLAPKFDVQEKILPNGHKDIEVKCTLIHINTGKFWGEGVGSCSTMESKYRYRSGIGESTKVVVPKAYWDKRRINPSEAQELIGGKGYTTKKGDDGLWWIHEKAEKQENPDIADVYNTVLKIAKKRAVVDATITATAASDIFTQDLEEIMPEKFEKAVKVEPVKEESPKPVKNEGGSCLTHDECLELFRLINVKNVDKNAFKTYLNDVLKVPGTNKIKKEDYAKVTEWIIQNERDGQE